MESYEATKSVFSRIQNIDPQNASKIIGYILLYYTEKDMIRFAYGPETLIISIVNKAKTHLGLSSNTLCAPTMATLASLNPNGSNPLTISRPNPLALGPRLATHGSNPPSPSLWTPHHYGSMDQKSVNFLNDPLKRLDFYDENMDYPCWENSRNDEKNVSFDDLSCGFGVKPCVYYARGGCKNGSSCKFVHGGGFIDTFDNNAPNIVGSNCNFDGFGVHCQNDVLGSNFGQQQRIGDELMCGGFNLPFNKLNLLPFEAQRSAATALMMGEDFHKLNSLRMARNELACLDSNPVSRQIYLTFPADSTFKEEDVSSYFNLYGPVQDVRIPYQQKRMFGFVTFVYPETVKIILAKGNPHFVCDSRVLVKPYKEKSKLPDKKQHQQPFERGEFSQSGSPPGHECRDPYDFHLGERMLYNTQEMLLRKKLEESDLQQALELQGRRFMNLQLLDLENYQNQHNTCVGSPILSPSLAQAQSLSTPSIGFAKDSQDAVEDNNGSPTAVSDENVEAKGVDGALSDSNGNDQSNEDDNKPKSEESELSDSGFEHILPDNLFASPKKSASEQRPSLFLPDVDNDASSESLSAGQGALGL